MNTKQQGFTLIELVVVIVILGILAAVAVPKFVSMQGDARLSVLQGVAASMRSTSAMIHAKALASGATTSLPGSSVEGYSGATIALVNGYPSAAVINDLLDLQGTNFNRATAGTVQITGGTSAATCQVTYANATIDASNVVTPPTITITNNTAAGCN